MPQGEPLLIRAVLQKRRHPYHQNLGGRRVDEIDDRNLHDADRIDGKGRDIEEGSDGILVKILLKDIDHHGGAEWEGVGKLCLRPSVRINDIRFLS